MIHRVLIVGVVAIWGAASSAAEIGREQIAETIKSWDESGYKEEQANRLVGQWFSEKKPPEKLLLTFFEERARISMGSNDTELFKAATALRKDDRIAKRLRDDVEKHIGEGDDREKKTVLLVRGIQTHYSRANARKWNEKLKTTPKEPIPWPICVVLGNCNER